MQLVPMQQKPVVRQQKGRSAVSIGYGISDLFHCVVPEVICFRLLAGRISPILNLLHNKKTVKMRSAGENGWSLVHKMLSKLTSCRL